MDAIFAIVWVFEWCADDFKQNKELEATEERKRKAKQLELQRKDTARRGISSAPRTPVYPTYNAPAQNTATETYDSYEAEKKKAR